MKRLQHAEIGQRSERDPDLKPRIQAQRACDRGDAPAPPPTARAQAGEKRGERGGGSMRGIAKQQAELLHPQDLIDQPGESRDENQRDDELAALRMERRRLARVFRSAFHFRSAPPSQGDAQQIEQALEVVVAVILDLDPALLGRMLDGDVGGEAFAQLAGDRLEVDVRFSRGRGV